MSDTGGFPRDPRRLLREVDAALQLRDIEEWQQLREMVAFKWWESALVALLFISGVGIIVTASQLIPESNRLLYLFIMGWIVLWTLTLISCIEFLLLKFRALRRMYEAIDRRMKHQESQLDALRHAMEAMEGGAEETADLAGAPGAQDPT